MDGATEVGIAGQADGDDLIGVVPSQIVDTEVYAGPHNLQELEMEASKFSAKAARPSSFSNPSLDLGRRKWRLRPGRPCPSTMMLSWPLDRDDGQGRKEALA